MAVIDTINVGGADYSIQDAVARANATNAMNKANVVESEERDNRQAPAAFFFSNPERAANNTYQNAHQKGKPFFWNSFNYTTQNAGWYPSGMLMRTTKAVTAGTLINPGVNCEPFAIGNYLETIRTYVGSDGKIHFTDTWGADSALNFSGGGSSSEIIQNIFENGSTTQFTINSIENAYIFIYHQNNEAAGYRGGHKFFVKNGSNVGLVAQQGDYSRIGFSSATANSATFTYVPNGNDILGYYACKF